MLPWDTLCYADIDISVPIHARGALQDNSKDDIKVSYRLLHFNPSVVKLCSGTEYYFQALELNLCLCVR